MATAWSQLQEDGAALRLQRENAGCEEAGSFNRHYFAPYSEQQKLEFIGEPTSWKASSGDGGTHLARGSGRAEFILFPMCHSSQKLNPHLKMVKYSVSSLTRRGLST